MSESERVRPAEVARMTSLSIRKVQELAAAGKIPGAAKLGGVSTFDPDMIRRWIKHQEQAAWRPPSAQAAFINAARLGGDAARLPDASIEARYEQLIGARRPSVIKRGGSNSNAKL